MRSNIRNIIKKIISDFNNDYYPEVIVSFIGENDKGDLAFLFEGHFCLTCGMQDYFIDFANRLSKFLGENFIVLDKYPINEGYDGWIILYTNREVEERVDSGKFLILDPKTGRIIRKIKVNEID